MFQLVAVTFLFAAGCEKGRDEYKHVNIQPIFEDNFIIPDADNDQHGNPVVVRNGLKYYQKGLPFEIWLKQPRIEFVLIPAGEFIMGSPDSEEGRFENEGPLHRVTFLKSFYMSKYEVTQSQWIAVMGRNPSQFAAAGNDAPVEMVSWNDCIAFCNITGWSLPSESQWEYACRAGTTTPFFFGTSITASQVNYNGYYPSVNEAKELNRESTIKVGSFMPNSWGLYDMHGNVAEWCEDNWHNSYFNAPTDGSSWIEGKSSSRIVRGGSWTNIARFCRSALRNADFTCSGRDCIGFRPVMQLP